MIGIGLYQLLMKTGMGIWPSGMIAMVIMLQYGMMTGGSVSAMRAVCMFLISIGAKILGRIYDMMSALAGAAIMILLESPAYLYSSSFLLSFGAVIGIGAVAPALERMAGVKGKLGKGLVSSFAVQITTLPVSLYFYGEVSVCGIFLNLIVLPTVGVVLGSGVAAVLLGCVNLYAGMVAALPGRVLLRLYEWLCMLAGKLPVCTWIGGQPKMWQVGAYYGLLGLVLLILWLLEEQGSGKNGRQRPVWIGGKPGKPHQAWHKAPEVTQPLLRFGCIAILGAGIAVLSYHPCLYLKITCLDVGQGDGIVVETPEKYCFLIDGGSTNKSGVGQYQLLPYLKSQGISYLDGIFISHTDEDHISGVKELLSLMGEGLTSVRAGCLYLPDWSQPPEAWEELASLAEKAGVQVRSPKEGDRMDAGKLEIRFLAPAHDAVGTDVNEDGMVLTLRYGDFCGLFTGDIGEETEKALLALGALEDVDFLKAGHHGSHYSTCQAFLDTVRPEYAVISCSSTNTYGHPSPETVERLEGIGCRIGFTMKSGAVTVQTDGKHIGMKGFVTEQPD